VSEAYTIQLNEVDEISFLSLRGVRKFVSEEMEAAEWLVRALEKYGYSNLSESMRNSLDSISNLVFSDTIPFDLPDALGRIAPSYLKSEPLFYSKGQTWEGISKAREVSGERAAAVAYAVNVGAANFGSSLTREAMIGMVLAAFPELGDPQTLAGRLASERANYRSSLDRRLAAIEDMQERQEREWKSLLGRAMHRSRRTFRKRIRLWNEQQKTRDEDAEKAVSSIHDTEKTYTQFMSLRAPVEYWNDEAGRHSIAKMNSTKRLKTFFPVALVLILAGFVVSACVLISANPENRPVLQFVFVAGMISVSTILFWVGRILTKLYLSEHHLEQDAIQRAVMTTTYLALLDQGGATDADRGLILSALFRSTPDGIVKDDAPGDVAGVAGVLSRLGIR
jgi:hypothetical protein